MEDLLSKIYDKVAYYEKDGIQFGNEYDCRVEEILKPLRETMAESEVEEIKELVYAASYYAQKYGFMLGVRFMAKLMLEAMESAE
ncbi:MAG: hypothetical protein IJE43_06055 [Alphaproteobacteria bacterium]|nr:hypothetical protein [Alphaproteobacteria bacterium]MBQ6886795.1 hypothetical protein [Lachnospiraceae bacterium]